jgi:hypothetical protein
MGSSAIIAHHRGRLWVPPAAPSGERILIVSVPHLLAGAVRLPLVTAGAVLT